MKIYLIWDNKEQSYLNKNSKVAWSKKGSAKNAVIDMLWYTQSTISSFKTQDRFECREFDLDLLNNYNIV